MEKLRGHVWIMQGMSCIQNQSFYEEEERWIFFGKCERKRVDLSMTQMEIIWVFVIT